MNLVVRRTAGTGGAPHHCATNKGSLYGIAHALRAHKVRLRDRTATNTLHR